MPNPDHRDNHQDEILEARSAESDLFGKLDDELPTMRINSDATAELERRWRKAGVGNATEYRRLVLYANLFGEEHVASLYADKIRRVVGNAATVPRKDPAA